MADIRALTQGYVLAFNSRSLENVADYMAQDFALTDPEVFNLTPKPKVLNYIQELFDANEGLSFVANRILVDGNASAIHFSLTLCKTVLDGVDLITWEGEKMVKMHAYLTPRPLM
jgi:ketosteroid isomerase-like protein